MERPKIDRQISIRSNIFVCRNSLPLLLLPLALNSLGIEPSGREMASTTGYFMNGVSFESFCGVMLRVQRGGWNQDGDLMELMEDLF